MNSRQGSRYIKNRMGNELKNKILIQNGIVSEFDQKKPTMLNCPRCNLTNVVENKYCSKCSYPLKPEAYDEIKMQEENRIKVLEENHKHDIITLRQEMKEKFEQIFVLIQQNPKLTNIKPEVLIGKQI